MNILTIANHYAVCSARYAADAFVRLGHTVNHVGPAMGRNIWGLTLPPEYVWTPDDDVDLYCDPPNGWDVCDDHFDLVIMMDSAPDLIDWYEKIPMNRRGITTIVWGVDNHVRNYRRPYFEHYFLAHRRVSVMEWEIPELISAANLQAGFVRSADMTHLPCGYDPMLHTPSPIPFEEREYDVCMIGVMYPQRWERVRQLRAAGFKVLAGTGLVYDGYVSAYHNSRISLCLSSNGDVAQRVFETAAMGCVVMTDNCPDFQLLKPDGFWLLEPGETLIDACKTILHEPEHAQAMIEHSLAWVKPHTWDARAKVIAGWWEREYIHSGW